MTTESTTDTGGDTGTDDQVTGIANADDQGDAPSADTAPKGVALDGGTADGEDNSSKEEVDGEAKEEADKTDKAEEVLDDTVPEEYAFTLPEGMEADEELTTAMSPLFKDLGLTQAQADKMVTAYAETIAAKTEAQASAVTKVLTGWVTAGKDDAEIGKGNWDASVASANSVIKKFGTPELVSDVMIGNGMGNHPEMIRLLARIGAAVADDTLHTGEEIDGAAIPMEQSWYGATTPTTKQR